MLFRSEPEAVSLTAELKAALPNIVVELLPEGKGIFDVKVDGELIYSKYSTGRFPLSGEVADLVAALKG